jgi:hypothetical protein
LLATESGVLTKPFSLAPVQERCHGKAMVYDEDVK